MRDASGLTRLSSDGAVLVRAVAGSLGIGSLDLPLADGPRFWRAEDIQAHLPLLKDHPSAARVLAKAVLKATRCGRELLAILGESDPASRDTLK